MGEKIERESGGGTGKVILVCVRAEYGNSEGEGSGPDQRLPDVSVVERVWEDEDMVRDEMIDQVLKALDVLSPRSREVLECVHLKNMKYAEVAELLGISVATVKTLLVRSLKTLRGIVSDTAFLLYVLVCKEKNK